MQKKSQRPPRRRKPRVQKPDAGRIERVFEPDPQDPDALVEFLLGIYDWGERQRALRRAAGAADGEQVDVDGETRRLRVVDGG
jgi:hypothetical protein